MPLGLLVVDEQLNILAGNPYAIAKFPFNGTPSILTKYLSLPKVRPQSALKRIANSGQKKSLTWNVDTGEVLPVTFSVEYMNGEGKKEGSYILFLE